MPPSVTAVIVTYNRKHLLERCVRAVLNQTHPVSTTIVVDNASTDGTEAHLEQRGILGVAGLEYMRLSENTGGAGGFFAGVKRAYEGSTAFFWLMDDDGVPDEDCLEKLLGVMRFNAIHYSAPNLIADNGQSHFARLIASAKTRVIQFRGGPFNGILISRELVRAIGYPMKRYFIWGDEYEYTNRIQDAGFPMVMVCDAIHRHKSTKYSLSKCPRPYHLVRNWMYSIRLSKGLYLSRKIQSLQAAQVVTQLVIKGLLTLNFDQVGKVALGVVHGLADPLEASRKECQWGGVRESSEEADK